MSQEQRNQISWMINWGFKIGLGILAYLAVTVFMDIRDNIHQLSNDVNSIKDRLIRVEMKLELERQTTSK